MSLFSLLFSLVMILVSCEKEEFDSIKVNSVEENTRIVFKSTQEIFNTLDVLSNMDYEEQMEWIKSSNIKDPLRDYIESCTDETMYEMPRAFQAMFNKDLEIQLNDTVIFFQEGDLYIKSIKNQNLSTPILFAKANFHKEEDQFASTRSQYLVPFGKISNSHQHEFTSNNTKFKYVHELKSVRMVTNSPVTNLPYEWARIFLILKLEWKGSKWREASEARNIYIDLTTYKKNLMNVQYNQEIILTSGLTFDQQNNARVEMSGSIMHEMVGRISTRETDLWGVPFVGW